MGRGLVRIQRKRTKGWRMPEGAVYVGRPTWWGNPFAAGESVYVVAQSATADTAIGTVNPILAVELYRLYAEELDVSELRGRDLACWCPLDQPCHADVLLELANAGSPMGRGRTDEHVHEWVCAPDEEEAWCCAECGLIEYPPDCGITGCVLIEGHAGEHYNPADGAG